MAEDGFTIEWPLWGLELVDRAVGMDGALQVIDTFLYQPTWAQWADMELTAVVEEYCAPLVYQEAMGIPTPRLPPPCLLRFSEMDERGDPDPPIGEHEDMAREVVSALRLYDSGDFIDPSETGTYISEPGGMTTTRLVEVFRCAPYRWVAAAPYSFGSDDVEVLEAIQEGVHWLSTEPRHANASLALENFVLSFGFATGPAERGLHRFIALEALLGTFDRKVKGSSFAERAAHAADGVADAREWLEDAATLRNSLAHNIHDVTPSVDDLEMLEFITRAALLSYLDHASSVETDKPLASFNRVLSAGPVEGPS